MMFFLNIIIYIIKFTNFGNWIPITFRYIISGRTLQSSLQMLKCIYLYEESRIQVFLVKIFKILFDVN